MVNIEAVHMLAAIADRKAGFGSLADKHWQTSPRAHDRLMQRVLGAVERAIKSAVSPARGASARRPGEYERLPRAQSPTDR
jgi:hypothetical protein